MKILRTRMSCQRWRKKISDGVSIGFVPTMGALHEGHLSLVKKAKKENDLVVVSIFVNPTQFEPDEDFNTYPRVEVEDLRLLKTLEVDTVFLPRDVSQVYPEGTGVEVRPRKELTAVMEGAFRPGHFKGVTTVVYRLFDLIKPFRAYFGEKDYQQLKVIEAMVQDLNLPIRIRACPIKRGRDGLALSSRNKYFSVEDRQSASELYKSMKDSNSLKAARNKLSRLGFEIDYLECWNDSLSKRLKGPAGRWLVAAKYKGVRLIDNLKKTA